MFVLHAHIIYIIKKTFVVHGWFTCDASRLDTVPKQTQNETEYKHIAESRTKKNIKNDRKYNAWYFYIENCAACAVQGRIAKQERSKQNCTAPPNEIKQNINLPESHAIDENDFQ